LDQKQKNQRKNKTLDQKPKNIEKKKSGPKTKNIEKNKKIKKQYFRTLGLGKFCVPFASVGTTLDRHSGCMDCCTRAAQHLDQTALRSSEPKLLHLLP